MTVDDVIYLTIMGVVGAGILDIIAEIVVGRKK